MTHDDNGFLPIPGLGHQDVAVVQSLLDAAGFRHHLHDGFGECADVVLIGAADLAAVKELLSDYTIDHPCDRLLGTSILIPATKSLPVGKQILENGARSGPESPKVPACILLELPT